MKFENYITEAMYPTADELEQTYLLLEKDCSEAMKVIKDCKQFMYHGKKIQQSMIEKYRLKEYRAPKDTRLWLSEMIDDEMVEKFGWAPRSEGIFVSGDIGDAMGYGHPHLFFPLNGFKFVWSETINDLTSKLGELNVDTGNVDSVLSHMGNYAQSEWEKVAWPDLVTGKGSGYWSFWPNLSGLSHSDTGPLKFESFNDIETKFPIIWTDLLKKSLKLSITMEREILPNMSKKEIDKRSRRGPTLKIPDKKRTEIYFFHWEPRLSEGEKRELAKIRLDKMEKAAKQKIKDFLHTYQNDNLEAAIRSEKEISVHSREYYLIRDDAGFQYYFLNGRKNKTTFHTK